MDIEQTGEIKLWDFEDILEREYGPIGTPMRDEFERSASKCVSAYKQRMLNFGIKDGEYLDDILLKYKEDFYVGYRKGIILGKMEVAKKLLTDGYPLETVARWTNLSEEVIMNEIK